MCVLISTEIMHSAYGLDELMPPMSEARLYLRDPAETPPAPEVE
jgi:hypothetical protein